MLFLYITFSGNADGSIATRTPNVAVDTALLKKIHVWTGLGASEDDIIDRLRAQTVPTGHAFHTWIQG